MKVSEHILLINKEVGIITESVQRLYKEIQTMQSEHHTQNNAPAWKALSDIELDLVEFREVILEDNYT